jgi:hypothetical protein
MQIQRDFDLIQLFPLGDWWSLPHLSSSGLDAFLLDVLHFSH